MNRIQKISWLTVICIGSGLFLSAVAIIFLYFKLGFPKAWAGFSFLGIGGFAGFGRLIFKKDPGPVQADERDRLINLKAARGSFALSYLVFGLLSMGIWEYCRHLNIASVKIDALPLIWALAAVTAFLSHAIIILVLYGRGGKEQENV